MKVYTRKVPVLLLCWLAVLGGCTPGSEAPATARSEQGEDTHLQTLQAENANLRDRVARAMTDLYGRTPQVDRDALLQELLRDPLAEVRRAGLGIVESRLASNEPVPAEAAGQVRDLVNDPQPTVREPAALLTAQLAGEQAPEALLERLEVEQVAAVRCALLTGLGRLQYVEALPAVLNEIRTGEADTADAAAGALARIAQAAPLDEADRGRAAKLLVARYRRGETKELPRLRESLVTAMGAVRDDSFVPVLTKAVTDPAATVRLSAVNALARLDATEAVGDIEPLLDDADRGVRQAAIGVVATLGGREYLPAILNRTHPDVEPGEAVRRQAWDVAMAFLADAEPRTLRAVADYLSDRPDAAEERIRVLRMLVAALESADEPTAQQLGGAYSELGEALAAAGRYSEAAPYLQKAWREAGNRGDEDATALRLRWIDALLAANDPAAIAAIADCPDQECFSEAMDRLDRRLEGLNTRREYAAVVRMCDEALKHLSERISDDRQAVLRTRREQAKVLRAEAERRRIGELCDELTAPDEQTRQRARSELLGMSSRAIPHILRILRRSVTAEKPDAATEAALVAVLEELDPELNGYDTSAAVQERLKVVEKWMQSHP